jgi:DNA primase
MTHEEELKELNKKFVQFLEDDRPARQYLLDRGLTEETIAWWGIGFCPRSWNNALRGRVTFPIINTQGHLVSIGGRILPQYAEDRAPKYYNLPYSKSTTLFGLFECIQTKGITERGFSLVVEDYFGVLIAHQVGLNNVVSVCGSFLTEVHFGMLLRETDTIVVAFDNDEGGEKGWSNAQEMSQKYNYPITKFPLEKDLDEMLLEDSSFAEEIERRVKDSPLSSDRKTLRERLRRLK